jgi:uncharacterized protein
MRNYRASRYTWDEAKRRENLVKHGIDFVDVAAVFDGCTQTFEDTRFPYGEQRFTTIGLLREFVVLIAHTERSGEIRIIHARKANKATADQYFRSLRD